MAKEFLVPIQMNQLEIYQPVMQLLSTDPSGTEGQLYANNGTAHELMYYNGSGWNALVDDRARAQNLVFAGPPSGADASPTFRGLVVSDIPDLSSVYAPSSHDFDTHSGDLDITDIGSYADGSIIIGGAADWVTLTAGTPGYVLTMGASRPEWSSPGAPSAHQLLGAAHSDTATAAASRGSLVYGNSSNLWDELTIGTANQHLASDGTDVSWVSDMILPTGSYLRSGNTLGNTIFIGAWDVDGAGPVNFITITSDNTPTMDLSTSVTIGSSSIAYFGGAFHDNFSDFVGNEHIDHSSVTVAINATANETSVLGAAQDLTSNLSFTVGIADNPVMPGTGSMTIPVGDTAAEPGSPTPGEIRYNSQTGTFRFAWGSGWQSLIYSGGAFHDGFSDYIAGEHFLQSEITAISSGVGSGILVSSSGTLSVLTGSSGIDTIEDTLTEDSTHIPTSNAVFDAIANAVSGGVTYQGAYNASTNTPNLETPTGGAVLKGYMYTVTVAGTFFTNDLEVGDVLIAEIDDPSTLADWTVIAREWDESFLALGDTPAAFTGSAGYLVMVDSTPDALEFVDPSTYALSNFNNDLSSLTNGSNGGIGTVDYNGSVADTVYLDLNNLATVSTMEGNDMIPIYDSSVGGTRNITFTNFSSYVGSVGGYTKKYSVNCAASTSTVVNHAFATRDVLVAVYDATSYDEVECDIVHTDTNNVTVTFAVAPTAGEYRIVVIG